MEECWSWKVEDAATGHLRNSGKTSIVAQLPPWITRAFPMGCRRDMSCVLLLSCLFKGIFTSAVSRMQVPGGTITNRQLLGGVFSEGKQSLYKKFK